MFVDSVRLELALGSQTEGCRIDILFICCRICHIFCRVLLTTWNANVARMYLYPCRLEGPADWNISLHTLPFLRVLVAACAQSRAMSNAILANRLARAVIPYLTKPILPQSEAKNAETADVGGSSQRKGKKRARGYEGDEVFKTNPGVLFGSPHEERVAILSIEGGCSSLLCEKVLNSL